MLESTDIPNEETNNPTSQDEQNNLNDQQDRNNNEETQDPFVEPSLFVRGMTHGGDWYPTDDRLESMMKAAFYYAPCEEEEKSNVVGIISPHSCYSVCLRTAAKSYARIDPTSYQNVIILGTCHHIALPACLVSQASEVMTPFGNIPVNTEICRKLCHDYPSVFSYMSEEVDNNEHSLEMQYPLIKYVFGHQDVKITPILVGCLNDEREAQIAQALKPILKNSGTLFIISSDFMHWGEIFKFTQFQNQMKPLQAQPELFDKRAISIITQFNYEHFKFYIEEIKGSICGCYAICLILLLLSKGYTAHLIDRTQLCEILCPTDFSISYVAMTFKISNDFTEEIEEEEEEND